MDGGDHSCWNLTEDKQDTRDWSLLCDFAPDDNDRSIKTLTSTGPITKLAWLNSMRLAWMLVITMNGAEDMDPEPHIQVSNMVVRGGLQS